jgi:release factor glutamine methyltransferase
MEVVHIRDVLKRSSRLAGGSDTPGLDLQVLLASIMGRTRSWVLAHPEAELTCLQAQQLERSVCRLEAGEPLAYLTGQREFFGMDFVISPAVLVPRPETELLVEKALDWLKKRARKVRCADVGTGSGCIAVTLAALAGDAVLAATDRSREALVVARQNARRHKVDGRILFIQGSLMEALGPGFDLICANLPYIPRGDLERLAVSHWEPRQALDGGEDGLAWLRSLIKDAPRLLVPRGLMLLEIEARQAAAVSRLAQEQFPGAEIRVYQDLAGFDRLIQIQR